MTALMSQYQDTPGADGVKRDGSFFQHVHLLYNGAYGKSFVSNHSIAVVLDLT